MHKKVVVAAVAAVVVGAVGCGSSSPLTSAELTSKANAICRQRHVEIVAIRKQHAGDVRAMIAPAVPIEQRAVKALDALTPPASAKADYERLVAIEKIYLARFKRLATRGGKSIEDVQQTHEVMRITATLGITDCQ